MTDKLTLLAALLFAGVVFGEPAAAVAPKQTAVIVNQAADAIVNYLKLEEPLGKGATREMVLAALRQTVDQYQGTGVSHVFWNVNYHRVAYRSAVWPSYWDVPDPEKNVTGWARGYYELHKLGIDDVFAIIIPRCRERGVSPWISLRMNDHHYTGDPSRVSPLFFEHPELRTRGGKGLFNFFNNFQPVDSPVLLRTPEGKEVVDCQVADLLRAASDLPGAMANARVHAVSIYETLPPKSTYQQVLPAEITPQKSLTLKIHTGPKPATGRCVFRVGLDKSDDLKSAQLAVRLNGSACRALEDLPAPAKPDPRKGLPRMNVCEVAPRLAQFEAPRDAVVRGYNAVELTVEHGGPQTVIWLEILIAPAPPTG